jgi:FkbM family methyltransferase
MADVDVKYLKKLIKKETPIIFDVGCYDGRDTLKLYKSFSDPKIYAFDADDRSIDLFESKIDKLLNIDLYKLALSDVDGNIIFYKSNSETRKHYDNQKSWSASSSIKKPDKHLEIFDDVGFDDGVAVSSSRLDTWMKTKDIDVIDLMWVDVNGGECEFLNGGEETIINKVRYLYIEFSAVNENKKLYENSWTKNDIVNFLPDFDVLGVYNFLGNFGNILLENRKFIGVFI